MAVASRQLSKDYFPTQISAWIWYSIVPTIGTYYKITNADASISTFYGKGLTATDISGMVVYEGYDGSVNVTYMSAGVPKPIITARILASGTVNGVMYTTGPGTFVVDAGA